jgi:hypothetical protein
MRNTFSRDAFGQAPDVSAYNVGQGAAQPVTPDERVRLALEAANYPFLVTPGHNFTIPFTLTVGQDKERTQRVYINSVTCAVRGREWRRVYSYAFSLEGGLTLDRARALLDEGNMPQLGSWYVNESEGRTWVGFNLALPADCPPAELDAAIRTVAVEADAMERDSVGTDDN